VNPTDERRPLDRGAAVQIIEATQPDQTSVKPAPAPVTEHADATVFDLFDALYRPGEHVSISRGKAGAAKGAPDAFRSKVVPAGIDAFVEVGKHAAGNNVWHGVNPVLPTSSGRGDLLAVTRLAALWVDLDVKPGAMGSFEDAEAVIADLSIMLGPSPAFVVHTGHGLHPYWLLDDERLQLTTDQARGDAVALLKRWHRLVVRVASAHGGTVDSVFDLPRVLRTPGTVNMKAEPVPVRVQARGGYALDVDAILEAFTAYGVEAWTEDNEVLGEVVAARSGWPSAASTCAYVSTMIAAWATDAPAPGAGRHHWSFNRLVRLACARRLGCVTDAEFTAATHLLQGRLDTLRAHDGLRPGEVNADVPYAVSIAERKTDDQARGELGGHNHDHVTDDDLRDLVALAALPSPPAGDTTDPGMRTPAGAAAAVHRGQARMAYRLADAYTGQLLYVHGLGWHHWDGHRWAEDDTGAATRAVLDVLRTALADSLSDKELRADVRRCESASGVGGVLQIASALAQFTATVRDLDADPYLLNVANGTLDLRTMELREHDPGDRITKITAAAYDPGANPDAWDTFLGRVLPDEAVRAFLQRYTGLALAGTVLEHLLAITTGIGRNGKSVFVNTVLAALGDYAASAEPDLFMHREGAHPTGEMDLRGVRWVVVSESDKGRRLAEATVKRLTGGDRIKARRMRQDFVEFSASHTPVLVTNFLPTVSGDDPALWARLRVVPFDVVIPPTERDPRLTEKLSLSIDAVLTWAVRGWHEYQAGGLAEPDAIERATEAYHVSSDAVGRFVEDCCLTGPNFYVSSGELWARWAQWAIDDGSVPIGKKAFGEALDQRGFSTGKGTRGVRLRRGIALAADEEEGADL
jgi:putative DNA primase/helicase